MNYGCIGERLAHSFSKEIHNSFANYEYELREITRDELDSFAIERDFKAINVTIPYKELIIPHLHYIDEHAKLIGAVNTVVNRDGLLYGYNTDFFGMCALFEHIGISVSGRKAVILGTGGTAKTAYAVLNALCAREILLVSRVPSDGRIDYKELYERHTDAEIIVNTTPVGMYPSGDALSLDISDFHNLCGVVDAVYNPLRTRLVTEAKKRGIPAEGGLYMLVAQAIRASEIFLDTRYPRSQIDRIYKKILGEKENIVLIGMPACGKTTVGRILSSICGTELIDTDELVAANEGASIPDIFAAHGEPYFRQCESRVINEISVKNGVIIATGGGAVLNPANIDALKQNGRIYFIDRPIDALVPTSDRPLSSDVAAMQRRYAERYPIYNACCDVRIDAASDADTVAKKILGDFTK